MHTYKLPHKIIERLLIVTFVFGTMYVLVQQQARQQANDMPELLATQAAKQLDAGMGLQSINMGATDVANHPVPFVVVYDKKGKAVAGSGYLNKKLAMMPTGVVNHATPGSSHAVTWAPREDIRLASVTVAAKDYYVVGGQSLQATESRAERLLGLTALGYGLSVATIVVGAVLCRRRCGEQTGCDSGYVAGFNRAVTSTPKKTTVPRTVAKPASKSTKTKKSN